MNVFQKQLVLRDGKNMAELSNPHRDGIGQPLPPQKISIEQFEADRPKQKRLQAAMPCPRCGKMVSVIGGRFSPHYDTPGHTCPNSGREAIAHG